MARLLERRFEWVAPAHGQWVLLPAMATRRELAALVDRMRASDQDSRALGHPGAQRRTGPAGC